MGDPAYPLDDYIWLANKISLLLVPGTISPDSPGHRDQIFFVFFFFDPFTTMFAVEFFSSSFVLSKDFSYDILLAPGLFQSPLPSSVAEHGASREVLLPCLFFSWTR